ncbi:DUF1800 domain-containing protein [Aureimonas leprariae]|uniref:DUF1800 domain-containing protein n=1 Tax=Plantimonas leprariae TaxID=2615207 RepID=A0A7V7PP68_9HYPH|nr:DUF1800 domain-containing protein [Aureimonas leprariae]KAB0679717.1 DUF1800 domain-containing protein [Aureimonas leprariae]
MAVPNDLAGGTAALNRFGLGARPDEAPPADPRSWLLDQFRRFEAVPAAFAEARGASGIFAEYAEDRASLRDRSGDERVKARMALRRRGRELYRLEARMRLASAVATPTPFVERLVHFWSNHFAVSADKPQVTVLAGAFEREAIRPHVLGRFADLALAAETHPAMLFFLDQPRSAGPNSRRAARAAAAGGARRPGINENLAREVMELHTLGARTGYDQKDVTEFALALTGWTVARPNDPDGVEPGAFRFRPEMHEPGERTILGRTYGQPGAAQARAVLRDLGAASATARRVAAKLARHFVADDPPDALVSKLADAFAMSDGDLPTLYRALIDAPEAWAPSQPKFKTPWDWLVSALRGLGRTDLGDVESVQLANQLGQAIWRPRSPAGYDDVAASWAAPDALMRRIEIAQRLVRPVSETLDARELAPKLLAGSLSEGTRLQVGRAESRASALALLLVSPEFLRR